MLLIACGPPMPPYVAKTTPIAVDSGPIVVLGDTQRTSFFELLVGREQNEEARLALVQKIAAEERPAFVVHLGDMVARGADSAEWEYFDRLISPLTARGLRIFPVLGNHDYWGSDSAALRNARKRFPQLVNTWYALQHHGLGLVWLDSNLEGEQAGKQAAWFERTLRGFDSNAEIRGVLVFSHHPAFTNGKGRAPDEYVTSALLPLFFKAKKPVAWLSGHVHGYEHFTANERTFLVSGGGGGPRVSYRNSDAAWPVVDYTPKDDGVRAFNYVVIETRADSLLFTVKCLGTAGVVCTNGVLEQFSIALAP
jgi:hypothetical protein